MPDSKSTTPDPSAPDDAVAEVLAALDLRPDGADAWTVQPREFGRRRLYGGQVFAQTLMAAQLSVDAVRAPHSVHACFLLPGSPDHPVRFEVERMRDGGAFSSRRVQALQDGRVILTLLASFHRHEDGFEHQSAMPEVAPPKSLASTGDLLAGMVLRTGEVPHAVLETSMTRRMARRPPALSSGLVLEPVGGRNRLGSELPGVGGGRQPAECFLRSFLVVFARPGADDDSGAAEAGESVLVQTPIVLPPTES